MIESIPRYKNFMFDNEMLGQSVHIQTIATLAPQRMNWPDEPWTPKGQLDKILMAIRNKHRDV